MPLPWEIDSKTNIGNPFDFETWAKMIGKKGEAVSLFSGDNQMNVLLCTDGDFDFGEENGIFQWIYQIVRLNIKVSTLGEIYLGWDIGGCKWARVKPVGFNFISSRPKIKIQSQWPCAGC